MYSGYYGSYAQNAGYTGEPYYPYFSGRTAPNGNEAQTLYENGPGAAAGALGVAGGQLLQSLTPTWLVIAAIAVAFLLLSR